MVLILVLGVLRIEAWPFSGFRLFSAVRGEVVTSWSLYALIGGDEVPIDLSKYPVAYRNTTTRIAHFSGMSGAAREAICDAWVEPLRSDGKQVDHVRIYSVRENVRPGAPAPTRVLGWECGYA